MADLLSSSSAANVQDNQDTSDDLTPTQPLNESDGNGNNGSGIDFPPPNDAAWGYLETMSSFFDSREIRKNTFLFGRNPSNDYIVRADHADQRLPPGLLKAISRLHFTIEKKVDAEDIHGVDVLLHDHSMTGTFVNGQKLGKGQSWPLVSNDVIGLCASDSRAFRYLYIGNDATDEDEEQDPWRTELRSRLPGELVNKYIVGQLLGRGTGGTVYLGYKKPDGSVQHRRQKVAIKVARLTTPNVKESRILQGIKAHPCVIGIIDVFFNDISVAIVMEYAKGGELFAFVEEDFRKRDFCERIAKLQFYQILSGVAHLHANGICHRDLKLENILLTGKRRTALLKITDFGLSKQWTEPMKSYVGTKMYMAPEVIEARNHPRNSFLSYTYKADMWSLGCILYSILCGCHAFVGEQDSTLEANILNRNIAVPMEDGRWKNVSNEAKDLVLRLLETDSSRRISAPEALKHQWFTKDPQLVKLANYVMNGGYVEEAELRRPSTMKRRRDHHDADDLQEATRKQLRIN